MMSNKVQKPYLIRVVPGVLLLLCAAGQTYLGKSAFASDKPGNANVTQEALDWAELAKVSEVKSGSGSKTHFAPSIEKREGKTVTVKGYMIPLEAKAQQVKFLLTSKSQDCEFCVEGGAKNFIEVHSKTPLRFSSQPFSMSGKLVLLRNDASGMYYRLTNASLINAQ